ncbi:DUF1634 domain-containing protein [Mucilaginibacter sp. dw_454]|uniref:DUF1634 domain-containing protein n=1 Tax=Mucilaginibacter sp. dw_454 TaxID=2720079 RepID=UPI001BD509CF|nr:DUF1634 domain-containing protein [Mucilaginibacter sp. dw_454]
MSKLKDTDIQTTIGWVLRTGVFLSVGICIFGAVIYLFRHGHDVANYHDFNGVPAFVHLSEILKSVIALRGRAIIQCGIILLIATPIIRVVCSAIGFAAEGDYLYTGITLLVLAIIFFSMLSGHGG